MGKRVFLATFVFVLFALHSAAGTITLYENVWYDLVNDSVARVVKPLLVDCNMLVIPQTIKCDNHTYAVESIGMQAFEKCKVGIFIIGDNVKQVGDEAFKEATIDVMQFGKSVAEIGIDAFDGATVNNVRTSLNTWFNISFKSRASNPLPNWSGIKGHKTNLFFDGVLADSVNVPKNIKRINDWAFTGCELTYLNADSVEEIGKGSFFNADIDEFVVSDKLKSIGDSACMALGVKKAADFNGVKYIGKYAFAESYMTDAPFGDAIETIGDSAFFWWQSRKPKVKFGKFIKYIGKDNEDLITTGELSIEDLGAWMNASIDFSIWRFPTKVFVNGKEMTKNDTLVIPEGVSYIAATNMMVFCKKCSSVVIPESVTAIDRFAFFQRSPKESFDLTSIVVKNTNPPLASWETFGANIYRTCDLIVPEEARNVYLNTEPWRQFTKFSGVDGVERENKGIRVTVVGNEMTICGKVDGTEVLVYTTGGQLVHKGKNLTFSVPGRGIYIVRIGGNAIKVLV